MKPYFDDGQVQLYLGDCIAILPTLEAASIDAIVTDPPYGLEFMGREWDGADGFRRSLNDADAGRDNVFGRTSRTSPEYQTAGAGQRGKPGIGDRPTEWVSNQGWNGFRCRNCGHLTHGGSPCRCEKPDFVRADNRWHLFQAWCEQWATECLRVLRPGGHLLAFGGTRTWHRLVCAIEDAGFEVRDNVADLTGIDGPGLIWAYGQGFPKSRNIARDIDAMAGAEREVIGDGIRFGRGSMRNRSRVEMGYRPTEINPDGGAARITAPATEDAARWEGWGTALKPSWEPIVVARKPLAGTAAANVLEHGTGALNIGGCRIPSAGESRERQGESSQDTRYTEHGGTDFAALPGVRGGDPAGRWPVNLVLGEDVAAEMDRQSGVRKSGDAPHVRNSAVFRDTYGKFAGQRECPPGRASNEGGASRFFPVFRYEAKADSSERPRLEDGTAHPTVKPVGLMRWLCRLVTPPGGLILDPFAGSGTTAEAAIIEGFHAVLIEQDPKSVELIRTRLRKDIQPDLFGGGAA